MLTFFLILVIIAAVVLVLIILAQNPKGGGLSATFGGSNQIIGARQTADFLEKATWYIAIGILVVVVATLLFIPNSEVQQGGESYISDEIEELQVQISPNAMQNPANEDE